MGRKPKNKENADFNDDLDYQNDYDNDDLEKDDEYDEESLDDELDFDSHCFRNLNSIDEDWEE